MGLALVTAPADFPLSLAKAKTHLQIYHDADDGDLQDYIEAGTDWLETRTRRAFMQRTYDLYLPAFPCDPAGIMLPKPPSIAVESIKYRDAGQVEQVLGPDVYLVNHVALPGRAYLAPGKSWPTTSERHDAVVVRYQAGYGASAADTPARARQALRLLVAHQYAAREPISIGAPVSVVPLGLRNLVSSLRVVTLP